MKSGESLSTNWGLASMPVFEGVEPGTTAATLTPVGVNAASTKQEAAIDFTGLWSGPVEGDMLLAVNGFYRASRGTYALLRLPLPYPRAVIDTVLAHWEAHGLRQAGPHRLQPARRDPPPPARPAAIPTTEGPR